jgi:hypothetical protein
LYRTSIEQLPRNITVAKVSGYSFQDNLSYQNASCNDMKIVKRIVDVLTGSSETKEATETCQNNIWKGKVCGPRPVLCVNCNDPCSVSHKDLAISPCILGASNDSNVIHILSIDYITPKPAPTYVITPTSSRSNVSLDIQLSDNGKIACGLFGQYDTPQSINSILIQNNVLNVMNENQKIKMDIVSLQPASQYYLYCTTTSTDNIEMTWVSVLANR